MLFYCGLLRTDNNQYNVIEGINVIELNKQNGPNGKHFLKSYAIYCVSLM